MIFDTHAHYDDEAFEEDRGALIASLAEQGIGRVVNVAADLASVSTSLTLAQQYPFIYAAVGVHPSNVQELTERDYEWLEEKLAARERQAEQERSALETEIEQLMEQLLRMHRERNG